MAITFTGLGSGLDLNGLVTQLISAEAEPASRRLDVREAGLQARISAYGSVKSALSQFRQAVGGVADSALYAAHSASSSNASVVTASGGGSAAAGTYTIDVANLAQAHTLASSAFASAETPVGTGTLSFALGSYDSGGNTFTANPSAGGGSVVIGSGESTLEGIRDAVNDAGLGVEARIVNDGTGARLLFSSTTTGADSSLQVTVSGDSGGSDTDAQGLSALAYDPTAAVGNGRNLSQTVAALDAQFTIDGLTVTSASNSVTGVIDGVTLELKGETSGTPVNVSVTRNSAAVRTAVQGFVDGFNDLISTFQDLSGFDADAGIGGVLLGDSLLRGVERSLRSAISDVVDGLQGAGLRSLADIGISTGQNGRLSLDAAALDAALADDPDAIAGLFAEAGRVDASGLRFVSAAAAVPGGRYDVNISQLASRGDFTGAASSSLLVDASNDTFSLSVDGVQSGTITLSAGSYVSEAALAAELQARINADTALAAAGASVSVEHNGSAFVITSQRYGSDSAVQVTAADVASAATLGIGTAVGTSTAGVDVAGTINGESASGDGRTLTSAAGLVLEVTGGSTGNRGTVTFSRGVAVGLESLLDAYLDGDAALESSIEGLQSRVQSVNDDRAALAERLSVREARLRSQFTALDGLLTQLQQTSDFLSQQLGSLPGAGGSGQSG